MSKPSTVCARVFLAGALSLVIQNAAIADTVIVTADRMIDVIGGRVVDHPQVTITDGRISAVGAANAAAQRVGFVMKGGVVIVAPPGPVPH